jgi:UDP-glucuronate 4-epimerase
MAGTFIRETKLAASVVGDLDVSGMAKRIEVKKMRYIVTGAAGFIGFHTSAKLLEAGHQVVGIDNLNAYYEPSLKEARLAGLHCLTGFSFLKGDICDASVWQQVEAADVVINLAAQAGVRHSLSDPFAYEKSNLHGFLQVLEYCRHGNVGRLVYASSSSVYGGNTQMPFSVTDRTDHPLSLYAATKKANELMAESYAHLYRMQCVGLRFFTVYGPWGRPDMALFKFTKSIIEGQAIDVYNHGKMQRDFTYIDDIVEGVVAAATYDGSGHQVFNLGNNSPVTLDEFICCIEQSVGKKAIKNMLPMQPGDVEKTYADIDLSKSLLGFAPKIKMGQGIDNFVAWYRGYYGL